MERLALQESGDVRAQTERREMRYESVLYTKPENCASKIGTSGTPIKLLCNYFEILSQPNWVLYQYHVEYTPVVESKKIRIALLASHETLFPTNKAFDGSTLYSLTRLPNNVTDVQSVRTTDNTTINIKLKLVDEIAPTSPNFIHLFNIVFRKCLRLYGMKEIDRNYYDMTNRILIREYNLNLINGFATSIASYDEKLLLCCELTHKLLHNQTVYELMMSHYNNAQNEEHFRSICMNDLVGRIIMTKYNDQTYKIADIDWDSNPASVFSYRGNEVTFIDYYRTQYQINIQDARQPLLVILPTARDKRRGQTSHILLIPELSILTGVSETMRTDFRFKKALDQFAKVDAGTRCNRLQDFVGRFKTHQQVRVELDKWRMDFSNQPLQLDARFYPPETLGFGDNKFKALNERADWTNDMRSTQLFNTIFIKDWLVIYAQNKANAANVFYQTFFQVAGPMGIKANEPRGIALPNDHGDMIANCLKQNITETTQMVVLLVNGKKKDRYDAIKKICCLEKPVPSQVVTTQIIEDEKKCKSVITKVAIQINCKLGGELWITNIPSKKIMICGIDTYHDSLMKKKSVCAFIATSNETKSTFFSRATLQENHQELSNNLTLNVKSAVEFYRQKNGFLPEKIIIYRDGISDGQLRAVVDYEIPQIKEGFRLTDASYSPGLAFIVVKKRGNARFFDRRGNQTGNPPCGTIIDSGVTRPEWFDFYLISQHVTQGTVNPTHYNVIHDTVGYKADIYQRLSYKLTHMYYNWPGTIRVPALCQYAHKLAFLVGQSLHKEHHISLCDKLFYL